MINIVNYGLGNVHAFKNIFDKYGIKSRIINNSSEILNSDKIILPGVGSFDWAMSRLESTGLVNTLNELVLIKKVPILGVCVGMQIMGKSSTEGSKPGLGWIDGVVDLMNNNLRLPHMGWNTIETTNSMLFSKIEDPNFYFLHSYCYKNLNAEFISAKTYYTESFCCAFEIDNIYGVQFHPEKSHKSGIQLLLNFAEI